MNCGAKYYENPATSCRAKDELITAKTIAYMITWTTYGTWLQGDKRGFVKDGKIYPANQSIEDSNRQSLAKDPVKLCPMHQRVVRDAILEAGNRLNQKIYALSVSANHVHIVAEYVPEPIGLVVRHFKGSAQAALRKAGVAGRIWTRGFDKRYCFDEETLKNRIDYVNMHNRISNNI
jgi:REP element-mobilizing transposase RayT